LDEQLKEAIHWVTRGIEVVGVAIIVAGAAAALLRYLGKMGQSDKEARIGALRSDLGLSILLGLEFLVAADIVNTVAIEPTMDSVLVLGAIVLIRTFLSFSLEVEIEGRWPWQRTSGPRRET